MYLIINAANGAWKDENDTETIYKSYKNRKISTTCHENKQKTVKILLQKRGLRHE